MARYWIDARLAWYRGARPARVAPARARARARRSARTTRWRRATSSTSTRSAGQELEGVANRGDYDLRQHTEASGTKLEYVDPDGSRYMPFVIEPAVSIDRIMLALLVDAYDEEVVEERQRTAAAVPPGGRAGEGRGPAADLEGAGGHGRAGAQALRGAAHDTTSVEYDDAGNIGRRYRRQDEIGTPWAFTIDDVTLEDGTVTVRDRDSLAQERLPLEECAPGSTTRSSGRGRRRGGLASRRKKTRRASVLLGRPFRGRAPTP